MTQIDPALLALLGVLVGWLVAERSQRRDLKHRFNADRCAAYAKWFEAFTNTMDSSFVLLSRMRDPTADMNALFENDLRTKAAFDAAAYHAVMLEPDPDLARRILEILNPIPLPKIQADPVGRELDYQHQTEAFLDARFEVTKKFYDVLFKVRHTQLPSLF